jgi:hypothetical protein
LLKAGKVTLWSIWFAKIFMPAVGQLTVFRGRLKAAGASNGSLVFSNPVLFHLLFSFRPHLLPLVQIPPFSS